MSKFHAIGLLFACLTGSALAQQNELKIAAFNMAWAGTAGDFERHVEVCSDPKVNWCDARAKGLSPTDDEKKRAESCQAAFDEAAKGAAAGLQVAPCNAYGFKKALPNADKLYQAKLDGLRRTIERLISEDGVNVIAIQEVKSKEAIDAVLGKHAGKFGSCVAAHSTFQTVGFAWDISLAAAPDACKPHPALAIKERPSELHSLKLMRPGASLELDMTGRSVVIMNVHLKSGCANLRQQGNFPARLLTDEDPACVVLNRQVAPLEEWLESVADKTPYFVLLGDFNRRLDEEAQAKIPANKVRLDGSDPAKPLIKGDSGTVTSKYLWQELADGKPGLVQVPLESGGGCTGFQGLDHILVSPQIAKQTKPLTSRKVAAETTPGQKIKTSDHCPRVATLRIGS